MLTKLNKVEGSKEQCPNCSQTIFCRMSKGSDKYPAKLQWQNEDGTAHYNFDFKTKETSCKDAPQTTRLETITMPKTTGTDTQILERMKKEAKEITKQYIAKYLGVKEECDECGITNPAVLGMIYKSVVDVE